MSDQIQSVFLTFSDGTIAQFSGRKVVDIGDTRTIVDIEFGEPKDLPEDCYFEEIKYEN